MPVKLESEGWGVSGAPSVVKLRRAEISESLRLSSRDPPHCRWTQSHPCLPAGVTRRPSSRAGSACGSHACTSGAPQMPAGRRPCGQPQWPGVLTRLWYCRSTAAAGWHACRWAAGSRLLHPARVQHLQGSLQRSVCCCERPKHLCGEALNGLAECLTAPHACPEKVHSVNKLWGSTGVM